MATKVSFQLESSLASKHLTDAEYIKGGYIVVNTIEERDTLPIYTSSTDGIIVKGSLVHVAGTVNKTYRYNGTTWVEEAWAPASSAAGTLATFSESSLTPSLESLTDTISLHKISKTGEYADLLNKPDIPDNTDYVDLTSDQAIEGEKTFKSRPQFVPIHVPSEYKELEYIVTAGTSYINTNHNYSTNEQMILTFQQNSASNYRIWGAFNQQNYVGQNISLTYASGWGVRYETATNQQRVVNLIAIDAKKHTLDIKSDGTIYFDEISYGKSPGYAANFTMSYPAFLGTINPGGATPSANLQGKIFYYAILDANGDYIQRMYPVQRKSDSKTGMYDIINDVFYYSITGTDFVAGTEKTASEFLVRDDLSTVAVSGDYRDLSHKPTIPTSTSQLSNNSGFITNETDQLHYYTKSVDLASVATSGNYGDLNDLPSIPDELADLRDDTTHRLVTDTEKATWNGKQDTIEWDSTPVQNSQKAVRSGGLYTALEEIRQIAEGKTTTYVISTTDNPAFNTQSAIITITTSITDINGNVIPLSDFRVGDIIYIRQTDVPDRWVGIVDTEHNNIICYILETTKIPVTDVKVNGTSVVTDTVANISSSDDNVRQTERTDNNNFKLLFTPSPSPVSGQSTEAAYNSDITINPSTKTITADYFNGDASTVGGLQLLDQSYAYMGKLSISIECSQAVAQTGFTESEIFALEGNRYGKLFLASDTNKYWRRKDTSAEAASSHWRNDTTAILNSQALPNQLTTEDYIYVRINTGNSYYSQLPKFFVTASYDNINGSTQVIGFCRKQNKFEFLACSYNGNNLVGVYQPSGNTNIYVFKFTKYRSSYGAAATYNAPINIYYNFCSGTPTIEFISASHADYNTVKGYNYVSSPEFGVKFDTNVVGAISAITRSNTTSTASPALGGTFTAIDSVTSNSYGQITAVNTKTVTLPNITIPTKNSWNYDDRYVRYDVSQSLTSAQMLQARTNIGAGTSNFTGYTSEVKLDSSYINWPSTIAQHAVFAGPASTATGTPTFRELGANDITSGTFDVARIPSLTKSKISDFPVNLSAFTNDSGFITKSVNDLTNYTLSSALATVATSGSYNDLADKPTIPTKASWNYDDKYVGYTTNTNVTVPGTGPTGGSSATKSITTYTYDKTAIYTPNGLIMGGTAQNAGLTTRGICGVSTPGTGGACTKENLYINFDGDSTYRAGRQVVLQAGTVGTHYGNNVYQYAAVRGDAMKAWVEAKGYKTSDTNYYHTPTDSTGIKIGNGTGVNDLYVPYATDSAVGAMRVAAGTNTSVTYSNGVATITASDTTYSNLEPASGGEDVSLVTTGDKYIWNNKSDFTGYTSSNKLSASYISGLATVATSGSYNDLSDKLTSETAASSGTTLSLVTTGEKYIWNNKQAALATQTAYTSKGSATKVPQITTNTLGQVTGITEVDISVSDSKVDVAALSAKSYFLAATSATGNQSAVASTSDFIDSSGNIHTTKAIFLESSAGSISQSVSRLYFGTSTSSYYSYLASNTSGAFSLGSANGAFTLYANTSSYNCIMSNCGADLGRSDTDGSKAWNNYYTKGRIYNYKSSTAPSSAAKTNFWEIFLPRKDGTLAVVADIPTALSDLTDDATHRLVTDINIALWQAKAEKDFQTSMTLTTNWTDNEDGTYSQTYTFASPTYTLTANSKVDLQPNATVINQMITDNCKALYTQNNNGTCTVIAVGAPLSSAVTIQCTIQEVRVPL